MRPNDASGLIARSKPIHDNATLPGNGNMADVLALLYHLTGNEAYRECLAKLLAALTPPEPENALHQLSMLMEFEILDSGMQMLIAGDGAATTAFRRAAIDHAPSAHPAAAGGSGGGTASAYVCIGTTFTLPLTESKDIEDHLRVL